MKVFALAVLLAVMQASPPVPRQTPDANAGNGQAVQTNPDAIKKPQQGATSIQTIRTQPNGNANPSKSNENAERPVRIVELPPVSVLRDRMDVLALIFSGILLIVGIIGVLAAYRTLRAVESQAGIMRDQLMAMRGQISEAERATATVISKERARVRIEVGDLKIDSIDGKFFLAMVEVRVSNLGAMKAFLSDAKGTLFMHPSSEPQTDKMLDSIVDGSVILPDQTFAKKLFCISGIKVETIKALNVQTAFMHLYGAIHYTDVFGSYVTSFRYIWTASYAAVTGEMFGKKIDTTTALYGRWEKHGPESGNAAT